MEDTIKGKNSMKRVYQCICCGSVEESDLESQSKANIYFCLRKCCYIPGCGNELIFDMYLHRSGKDKPWCDTDEGQAIMVEQDRIEEEELKLDPTPKRKTFYVSKEYGKDKNLEEGKD